MMVSPRGERGRARRRDPGEGDLASLGGVQIQPQNGGEVQGGGALAAVLADEQSEGDLPLLPAGSVG